MARPAIRSSTIGVEVVEFPGAKVWAINVFQDNRPLMSMNVDYPINVLQAMQLMAVLIKLDDNTPSNL